MEPPTQGRVIPGHGALHAPLAQATLPTLEAE
jgi:hypothetical protein